MRAAPNSFLEAGAKAIATSSWSVAEAQGYRDGEVMPIELAEQIVARIAATIDVPVTVAFEGEYSEADSEFADNIARLLDLGVIGINFEDRMPCLNKGQPHGDVDRLRGAILRTLPVGEMAEHRRPFAAPGERRRPMLTWPRRAAGWQAVLIKRVGNDDLGVGPQPQIVGADLGDVADQLIAQHGRRTHAV